MKRRTGFILAGVAIVGLVAAGVLAPKMQVNPGLLAGFHLAGDQLHIRDVGVSGGKFEVGYSMTLRYVSQVPGSSLDCGLVDNSNTIGAIENSFSSVPGTGEKVTIAYKARYDLPEITISLRCSPTATGGMAITIFDSKLVAQRIVNR